MHMIMQYAMNQIITYTCHALYYEPKQPQAISHASDIKYYPKMLLKKKTKMKLDELS